jgi:hypothetical protein
MGDKIYVVVKDMDGMGREKNICVTPDADNAKEIADEAYEAGGELGGPPRKETFIQVWEPPAEEMEFVTRAHPGDRCV